MDGVGGEMVLVLPAAHLLLCLVPNMPQNTLSMAQGLGTSPLTHLFHASLVPFLCQALCVRACSVAQSCPTLCNPMDCSLPGSSVHRILQAGIWRGLPYPPPGDLSDPGIRCFPMGIYPLELQTLFWLLSPPLCLKCPVGYCFIATCNFVRSP